MDIEGKYGRGQPPAAAAAAMVFAVIAVPSFAVLTLLSLHIFSMPSSIVRTSLEREDDQWVEVISWEPRAFFYHNFLSKDECEHMINLAKTEMQKSAAVDNESGKTRDSRPWTSSGVFIPRGHNKIVREIEERIADFTFIPVEHGEGLQILHYDEGLKYEPHYDYFLDEFNTKNGGQRVATFLMYLSDVEEGGETILPSAKKRLWDDVPGWNELSECGKWGVSLTPKMGDALLLWNTDPDGTPDRYSLHGGCPVINGTKWSSTKWIRDHEYKVELATN